MKFSLKNKTAEALIRGYVFFKVNDKRFFTYAAAKAERERVVGPVLFIGWHLFKGWRTFFLRYVG